MRKLPKTNRVMLNYAGEYCDTWCHSCGADEGKSSESVQCSMLKACDAGADTGQLRALYRFGRLSGKMCQKLMKFDRSCRLINIPHYRLIVFLLTDLTLISIDIFINNKITVKAAFNSGKCKNLYQI